MVNPDPAEQPPFRGDHRVVPSAKRLRDSTVDEQNDRRVKDFVDRAQDWKDGRSKGRPCRHDLILKMAK